MEKHNAEWYRQRAIERKQYKAASKRAVIKSYYQAIEELEKEFSRPKKTEKI